METTPFENAYQRGMKGLYAESAGVSCTCQECLDTFGIDNEAGAKALWEKGELFDEGSFSWRPCDLCGSHLGGDRYIAHALMSDDLQSEDHPEGAAEIIHLAICTDCLFYMANGDLPEEWEA